MIKEIKIKKNNDDVDDNDENNNPERFLTP